VTVHDGKLAPNIGLPLFDCSLVASSWITSQCSMRMPFIRSLGYGDWTKLFPRIPRLSFEDACRIA
jgi:hypothetical protein